MWQRGNFSSLVLSYGDEFALKAVKVKNWIDNDQVECRLHWPSPQNESSERDIKFSSLVRHASHTYKSMILCSCSRDGISVL